MIEDRAAFQAELLDWFAASRRPLPWRKNYEPYHVWIAEVILQQTQMERGVERFQRFIAQFPDVRALAEASEDEVLKAWEGLGYYRRAHNLRRAARALLEEHGGRLPDDPDALKALPGVGPYTAAAILCQAFNRPRPVIDANVERVLARLTDLDQPVKTPAARRSIEGWAEELMVPDQARDWSQALMELGALVCRKRPDCAVCPVARHCESLRLGIVQERPVPGDRPVIQHVEVVSGVLASEGRVLIQKRLPDDVWGGLWEFPGGCPENGESLEQAIAREFMEELELAVTATAKLAEIRHGYTRFRVTLHCFALALTAPARPVLHAATEWRWASLDEAARLAFPAGHKKLLDQLQREGLFER